MARVCNEKIIERKEKKGGQRKEFGMKSTYPFEACATGCYHLKQYCYWGSLLSMLAIQKGSLCQLHEIEFDFGRPSFRVMIHLHTRHQDGFNVLMRRGVKSRCLNAILWDDVS